jgi:preprotein translocase subunit SecG
MGKVKGCMSVGQTTFSLLRAMMGDFEYEEFAGANGFMAPLMFFGFVVLTVFVVLMMLIAIITESHEHAQQKQADEKEKHGESTVMVDIIKMADFMFAWVPGTDPTDPTTIL